MINIFNGKNRIADRFAMTAASLLFLASSATWSQTLKHDVNNRLMEIAYPDGKLKRLRYDSAGNIMKVIAITPGPYGRNLLLDAAVTDSCPSCQYNVYGNPAHIADGDNQTGRNLGTSVGFFNLAVGSPIDLWRIRMLPSMSPSGNVDYEVLTTTDAEPNESSVWVSHGRSTEAWANGVWFEKFITNVNSGARVLKIIVYGSPSWVALFEVEGFNQ